MADSDIVRSRRKRLHAAGDHSLCVRCDALRATEEDVADAEPVTDPAAELAALAGRLVAASTSDPGNAMIARELRQTLLAMADDPVPPVPPVDEVDRIRQSWEAGSAL